jgi:hypothetical protein
MGQVNVTNSHCPELISGFIVKTANITGILSTTEDKTPTKILALVAPSEVYINSEVNAKYPIKPKPPGVGGSLLSVGSAAGVALMGQSNGLYTFVSHLKWTPVIALGYGASIYAHILINGV